MNSQNKQVLEWITFLCEEYSIAGKEKGMISPFFFTLEGFADEPMVYIKPTKKGLEFGYEGVKWNGQIPELYFYKKHLLNWNDFEKFNTEERQEKILELLMKTMNTRKRQYKECQFCGEKVATEHRFDKNTCHGCASEHLGVVY